ncbi:retrovirus-related Pol polyprotein from transposon 17.6 [Trichonephila clavipes]|nr:retrovirus-related Pol polyprotein from transposon 17.6 [Trichonephila clavipes]
MFKLGIIEVGELDYMSPMILVEVAGKESRPCIDYRKLNGIIRAEYFPLPNIEERVEKVSAAKFITVLDLSKGYWQIPLSKTAQRYAAFCTSFETYRPLRMNFGLKNAPYFFSKLMADLLNGLEERTTYLDDIAIFSDTWESHLKHVETVLQRIKRAKVFSPLVQSSGGSREFSTPHTKTQIRAFLGLAGYYQKYINLFSVIAVPLTDALKRRAKKGEITWTTECENAFRELKGKLIDKPVLYAPNFEREFIVQTDASNAGMGAVLTQINEQGEEHPILYLSTPIDADLREQILNLGPYQPKGNFQKDAKGRSFSSSYYSFISKAGQKIERKWLCYSTRLHVAYCQFLNSKSLMWPCIVINKNEFWANGTSEQTHMGKKYLLTIAIPGYRPSIENVELSSSVQHNASPEKNSRTSVMVSFLDVTGIKPCPDLSRNQTR